VWHAAAVLPQTVRDRPARSTVLAALLVALASLPLGHALAFDASAWVVWGREVWALDLQTGAGPSWKPFPVLFTAPFAVLGDGAGAAWLVVARAGALLAVVGAARLAARAAGPWAGVVAAGTLVLSPWWLLNGALGNADPLLGALVVWAFLTFDDGRPRAAFWLGVAGALIRPEVWPFLALYALWLLRTGRLPWAHALGAGAGVLALWVVPDALSSGLASTSGATGTASAGSAGLTSFPFGTVLVDLGEQAPWLGLTAALAGAGALDALRRRGLVRPGPAARPAWWLALVLAYTLLVAAMAQVGFAGNPRYLVPALVLLAAVSGVVVALPDAVRATPKDVKDGRAATPATPATAGWTARDRAAVAVVVLVALAVAGAGAIRDQARALDERAAVRRGLADAVRDAGGLDAVRRSGPVRSGDPGLRALVAETLHESVPAASARPRPGETVARPLPGGRWTLR
jgi:hypothetical protein